MKTLEEMQAEVTALCRKNGWYDDPRSFTESMMLLVTEVAEAEEAWRRWGLDDVTGRAEFARGDDDSLPKPEGVGSEFADILIRLLDDCVRYRVDLRAEYERKMAYNATRGYKHGGKKI